MKKLFFIYNNVFLIIMILISSSCSKEDNNLIDNPDDDAINTESVIKYVSENPSGRQNGDSEANAADYLDDSFWTQVNRDLRSKDVEVKFLPGDYLRIYANSSVTGLHLLGIGNKTNQLTISGGGDVTFLVPKGYKTKSNLILINSCQNIVFRGFNFTGGGDINYVLAIRSTMGRPASQNIIIENCTWVDMLKVEYGATGCHYDRTNNITYKNCTFKRIGYRPGSHMMYHAYGPTNINVIDCHFEDCSGDYIRFRDRCDFGLVKNSVFIRNEDFPNVAFIAVPNYNDVDPGDEYFGTNYSFTNNEFINNASSNYYSAIQFRQRGYSPKEFKYLLTAEEGSILTNGTDSEKKNLLLENFGIDVTKIRITNNTYTDNIENRVSLHSVSDYGAVSLGWRNKASLDNLMNDSQVPFDWEKF